MHNGMEVGPGSWEVESPFSPLRIRQTSVIRYAIPSKDKAMICPVCSANMRDVTDSWHAFAEAEGAEYLASYVTIWHCEACSTVVGATDERIEWIMEPEATRSDERSAPAT